MEAIIVALFENSLIGGAFVYLLWYVTNNFRTAIDMISTNMEHMGNQLEDVSKTLGKVNERMERVELRMKRVEEDKRNDG